MNGTKKTLSEIVAELERQKQTRKDIIVPSSQLNLSVDLGTKTFFMNVPEPGELGYQVGQYGITDFAHTQIATKCGIPQAYYDKMRTERPDLLPVNVNSWFPDKEKRFIRILDGKVRAILSTRYRVIDNYQMVDLVLENLNRVQNMGMKVEIGDCYLTEEHLYLKITSPDLTGEIFHFKERKDEPVRGGVIISNSEVGSGAFKVEPFVEVLVCKNGLIGEHKINKIHLGKERGLGLVDWSEKTLELQDNALISEVEDLIKATFNKAIFNEWLNRINQVASIEIARPTVAVENIIKKYVLPKTVRDDLINQFTKESPTVWGLSMAVTRLAQEQKSIEERIRWERIGSKILEKGEEYLTVTAQ